MPRVERNQRMCELEVKRRDLELKALAILEELSRLNYEIVMAAVDVPQECIS